MTATSSVIAPFEARMVHTERKNVAFGRNLGAEAAAGEIFVFLDADCIMPCDFVERLVDNLQQPGVKLSHGTDVFGDAGFISQAGKGMTRWFKPVKYTSGRGICIRKSDFWEVGGYNEECDPIQGCREDKDLGNRVVERWGLSALCLDRSVVCVEIARRPHESRLWEHRGWREGKPVDRRVYAKPGAFGRQ